jgi:hypothetical protein
VSNAKMVVTDADWASLTGRQSRSFEMRTGCHDDRYGQVRRWYPLEHGAAGIDSPVTRRVSGTINRPVDVTNRSDFTTWG